jgi:hypothetical protein
MIEPDASRRFRSPTTYRCPSIRFRAGRMISACRAGSVARESSSTQYGCRFPVVASSSTTGASRRSDAPMSVMGAAPVRARSMPGTDASSIEPGENPSLRFHSAGSIGVPATLRGICSGARLTRRPVGVDRSRTVK